METQKAPMLKIVSDGCGMGTRLLMPDGSVVPNVTRIDLRPITSEGKIEVVVTLVGVGLEIELDSEFVQQQVIPQE